MRREAPNVVERSHSSLPRFPNIDPILMKREMEFTTTLDRVGGVRYVFYSR